MFLKALVKGSSQPKNVLEHLSAFLSHLYLISEAAFAGVGEDSYP